MTGGGPQVFEVRNRVADFALRNGLPLVTPDRPYIDAGALLSYGMPRSEYGALFQVSIDYLDRILRGAKPAEMAVIQPSRYELVINMKTAKALGLTVPRSLLVRADEIVQ